MSRTPFKFVLPGAYIYEDCKSNVSIMRNEKQVELSKVYQHNENSEKHNFMDDNGEIIHSMNGKKTPNDYLDFITR